MQRVLVVGSPGAGKSTFARGLRDKTGLPLFYLDRLWHRPDRTTVSQQAFDEALQKVLQQDRWIIDGNYRRTLDARLPRCDTVFLLDIPMEQCLAGVEARIGQAREDMPWTETEFDPEFRQWIEDFPKGPLPDLYRRLAQWEGTLVVFHTRREADAYLQDIAASDNDKKQA